jgi:hypothetical protein
MTKVDMLQELVRRRRIVEACFPKQREPILGAIERGERQVAILTSRRAGKTNTVLRAICRDAADNPGRKYAYIGLSRVTAENIVWKELEAINDAHNCGLEMQGYRLRANFPNGSDITLYGADQAGWIKKFKGAKYRHVVIDEAGEFDIDLHDFIFRVIKPTLTDLRGTLWMIGTPGIVPSGYWWSITRPDEEKRAKGWNLYRWHSFDNPYIAEQFKSDLEELRDIYGDSLDELPWFRREWLGEWCTDTSNSVYRFNPDINQVYEYIPNVDDSYTISVDLGYTDATAFVVGAYNTRINDKLTFLECYRETQMSLDAVAAKIRELMAKYPRARVIADPDSKNTIATLCGVYGLPIEDAQKANKQQNIEYMNSSLVAGKVQFLMPACSQYAKEIFELKRSFIKSDERQEDGVTLGDWRENRKQPNDLCDCGLYIHREALNHLHVAPKPKVEYGTAEYYEQIERRLQEQALNKAKGNEKWWLQI